MVLGGSLKAEQWLLGEVLWASHCGEWFGEADSML